MTVGVKKIMALLSPGGALGFKMVGIETIEAEGDNDLADFLSDEGGHEEIGVLVVEEKMLAGVPDEIMRRIKRKGVPVIVPIHIPEEWQKVGVTEDYIANLIKSAIGYRLKIKK
ncbi:MAG: V-type ATP synthase subunit F [Thermodesulfobacteriota bacterium]